MLNTCSCPRIFFFGGGIIQPRSYHIFSYTYNSSRKRKCWKSPGSSSLMLFMLKSLRDKKNKNCITCNVGPTPSKHLYCVRKMKHIWLKLGLHGKGFLHWRKALQLVKEIHGFWFNSFSLAFINDFKKQLQHIPHINLYKKKCPPTHPVSVSIPKHWHSLGW